MKFYRVDETKIVKYPEVVTEATVEERGAGTSEVVSGVQRRMSPTISNNFDDRDKVCSSILLM